jgi:hypothetical protein
MIANWKKGKRRGPTSGHLSELILRPLSPAKRLNGILQLLHPGEP